MKKWNNLNLNNTIIRYLTKNSFYFPLPLQAISIPIFLEGCDLLCLSKTGSGKTLCYIIPVIKHVEILGIQKDSRCFLDIVIIPTRELIVQISREFYPFTRIIDFLIKSFYGGSISIRKLKNSGKKLTLLISTPRKLIEVALFNEILFYDSKTIVIDEADKIFELGFEFQIKKILLNCRPDKQICMYSASSPIKVILNLILVRFQY